MAGTSESCFPDAKRPYAALYPAEARVLESGDYGGGNWAKGYKAPSVETLIKMVGERLAAMGGKCILWLFHSLGGGYGAGAGAKFLEGVTEEFSENIRPVSIPILPGSFVSNSMVESYNGVLAMPAVLEHAHLVFLLDNSSLFRRAKKGDADPGYPQMDALAASALNTLVAPMLWPDAAGRRLTPNELHSSIWNPTGAATLNVEGEPFEWGDCFFCEYVPVWKRIISLSLLDEHLPGESHADFVRRAIADQHSSISFESAEGWQSAFVVLKVDHADGSDPGQAVQQGSVKLAIHHRSERSLALVAGWNDAMCSTLEESLEKFDMLWGRNRAFSHWYFAEGIDVQHFEDSRRKLADACNQLVAHKRFSADEQLPSDEG